jgi:hypothetical protein
MASTYQAVICSVSGKLFLLFAAMFGLARFDFLLLLVGCG